MTKRELINFYQELSTNSWPPRNLILFNGWYLRIAEGITQRANSVLPLQYYGSDVEADIEEVEKIYRANNIKIIFQLPDYFEPSNLMEVLLERGYEPKYESHLFTAAISDMSEITVNDKFGYELSPEISTEWLEALRRFNNSSEERMTIVEKIINRIILPKAFFTATLNGSIVGVVLGIIGRGYLGIYNMAVDPKCRRQGLGLSLIGEMIKWASENSVKQMYLQVQGDNSGAIALYKKVGLKKCYNYRYLIAKESTQK